MAKKQTQIIELEVITKGVETAEKSFKGMVDNTGDLGKKSKEILKELEKVKQITSEYGDEVPIDKARELEKILKKIATVSDEISEMDEVQVFGPKELETLKKINKQLDEYNTKIKKQAELVAEAEQRKKDRVEQLKGQKTVVDPNDNKKRVKLDSIQGKWKDAGDLTRIKDDPNSSNEQRKAAIAILAQLTKAENDYAATIQAINKQTAEYNTKIAELKGEKAELATTTRQTTDVERLAGESTATWASSLSKSIGAAVKANQELGRSSVDTSEKLKKQEASIGGAVKALFSWTQAWNIGKKLYREAINTIKEMDEALTGMAMVTGKSRDEVDQLIPRIQSLAKDTSTAMTEIAGLITEYTKQGRSLDESFVLAEETAKAAKIAGISAAESIQYMTSAINGFNLAAKDATRVSDVFANLAAISATDYEQLAVALSKVSAQANLAGMSMEYTTALLAKGIETTQEAPESIGTALKTIVARMRELSDYGTVLEDGASVNKVERALSAAGISLRGVNGEFRDLEEIFNELGPKWDSLNTMQQQAIAQAVAGTRQQSRFVAIMQDWERTQELAAEAQDSAGASAAQYAVYAQGMEAAMTNIKTAWQEFTQSLTSSKIIISIINGITSALDGVTKFLEGGGELTKVIFLGITGIVAMNKVLTPLKEALGMTTDKEKLFETEKLRVLKEQTEVHEANLKKRQQELETLLQIAETELELTNNKQQEQEAGVGDTKAAIKERETELWNEAVNSGEGEWDMESDPELISLREQLKLQEEQLAKTRELAAVKQETLNNAQTAVAENEKNITQAHQDSTEAATKYNEALAGSNSAQATKIQTLINSLDLERKKIQLAQEQAKKIKDVTKREKELTKLKKQEEKISKRINALEEKKRKILSKTQGVFSRIGTTLATTIESSLQGMFKKLGPIGDLLSEGLTTLINWGTETASQLVTEYLIAKAKKEQTDAEEEETAKKTANLGLAGAEVITEEAIEESKEDQVETENVETASKLLGAAATSTEIAGETGELAVKKKNTNEEKKGLGVKIMSALVTAAKSAAEIPMAGWIIALALLAAAGTAIAISAAAGAGGMGGGMSDKKSEDKIANQQNTIYQKKKENSELSKSTSEMDELMSKDIRSAEDDARIKELADGLRGQNEAWKNLSDTQVLQEAKEQISLNNAVIERNIESNYELALGMEDLSSSVAQTALIAKMTNDQTKMIENMVLHEGADKEAIAATAAKMTEHIVSNNADTFSDQLSTQESSGWSSVADIAGGFVLRGTDQVGDAIATWANGGGFWAGMDELFLNGMVGKIEEHGFWEGLWRTTQLGETITGFLDREQAEKEQKEFAAQMQRLNNQIVDFAVDMDAADGDLVKQLDTYSKLVGENNQMLTDAAKAQYSTIGLLYEVTNEGSKEVVASFNNLAKSGVLSSDALMKIVEAADEVQNGNSETIQQGLNAFEKGIEGTDNTGDKTKKADLDALRKELGLGEDATINEIKDAYLKKYAKFGADGNIQYDKNGNIAMKGNNKDRTAIFNGLNELSASLGEYADYSEEQLARLKKIEDTKIQIDLPTVISDLLTSVNDSLGLTENSDFEALQNDAEFQAKASAEIMKQGSEVIEKMTFGLEKEINSIQEQLKNEELTAEERLALEEELAAYQKNYNESVKKLHDATLAAAGYLSTLESDELLTRAESNKSNIMDIYEKIGSGEQLSAEDFAFIRDELAPQMYEKYGSDFDLNQFYQDLLNGSDDAYNKLLEIYASQGELTNTAYAKSIAATESEIDGLTEDFTRVVKDEDGNEQTVVKDEYKDYYDYNEETGQYELNEAGLAYQEQLNAHLATQKAQQEQCNKLSNEQLGLSAKELKLQVARNMLSKLESEEMANQAEYYSKRIEAQKTLLADINDQLDQHYDKLASTTLSSLNLDTETLKKYRDALNGGGTAEDRKAAMEWYNSLQGHQKDLFDQAMESIDELEEEAFEMQKSIAEDAKSRLEAQIDQQSQMIEHYKAMLEAEQEALQESLDKRKDMYDKYFDSLEDQEDEASFEEEQARLQRAIASLSTASDATSLAKLKEYQQQLADLEDEKLAADRDRRREAVTNNLDNQSEALDQYYEDRLSNEQALWEEISQMSADELQTLIETYSDEFKNATDLNKKYLMGSYLQLIADVQQQIAPGSAAAKAAQENADNYDDYLTAYGMGATDEDYNDNATYSQVVETEVADATAVDETPVEDDWKKKRLGGGAFVTGFRNHVGHNVMFKAYSTGGIVDYTGTAAVHGTPSKPEAFLNADQTALFTKLANNLEAAYIRSSSIAGTENANSGVVIENFTIAIDAELTNDNVQQTGESLADALLDGLRRTGISVNMKK
jgi:TP901 family phage tail tape measure protein